MHIYKFTTHYILHTCMYYTNVHIMFKVCLCVLFHLPQKTGWSALYFSAERGNVDTTTSLLKAVVLNTTAFKHGLTEIQRLAGRR